MSRALIGLVLVALAVSALAQAPVKPSVQKAVTAVKVGDRVLVPLRTLTERFNCIVTYVPAQRGIAVQAGSMCYMEFFLDGRSTANINGKRVTLDAPPAVMYGVTYVPARVVAEGMGMPVGWNEKTHRLLFGVTELPVVTIEPNTWKRLTKQ